LPDFFLGLFYTVCVLLSMFVMMATEIARAGC
jgi:hypothetical protein